MIRLSKGRTYTVPVLFRALDILEFLFQSSSPLKLDEIAKRTGVSRSSTYRILGTLEQRGYVSRSLDGHYDYCKLKLQPAISSRNIMPPMFTSPAPKMKETIWVEHTIETLVALLQESRRGNTVLNEWHATNSAESRRYAKQDIVQSV
jgi:IclR helix-turn-helix domain